MVGLALAGLVGTSQAQVLAPLTLGTSDNVPAPAAYLQASGAVAVSDGILFADQGRNVIRKLSFSDNRIRTIIGTGVRGGSPDGQLGTSTNLNQPGDVASDGIRIYFSDLGSKTIKQMDTDGIVTTKVENSPNPTGLAVGPDGWLYLADSEMASQFANRIVKIGPPGCTRSNCMITTVVGTGIPNFNGNDLPALSTNIWQPYDVIFDSSGRLYFSELAGNRVRRLNADGTVSVMAGGGLQPSGQNGDGGAATMARLFGPGQIAVRNGLITICEITGNRVRQVDLDGTIHTVVGTGNTNTDGSYSSIGTSQSITSPSVCAALPDGRWVVGSKVNGFNFILSFENATPTVTRISSATPSQPPATATGTYTLTPGSTFTSTFSPTKTATQSPIPTDTPVVTSTPSPSPSPTATALRLVMCDVTGDKSISSLDAAWILAYVAGVRTLTSDQIARANATANTIGEPVTAFDASAILGFVVGLRPGQPGYIPNVCGQVPPSTP